MSCTPECIAAQAKRAEEIAAWNQTWPNYCKSCGGNGGATSYYDPSPSGVSLGAGHMVDFEPCDECSSQGNCPRCGHHAWEPEGDEEAEGPCPGCGWNHGKNPDDCCPPEVECLCWCLDVSNEDEPNEVY